MTNTTLAKVYGEEFAEAMDACLKGIFDKYTKHLEPNDSTELTDWNRQTMNDMVQAFNRFISCTKLEKARIRYFYFGDPKGIEVTISRGSILKPAPDGVHAYWTFAFDF